MKTHFLSLIERLTLEEIELLNYLISKEATNRFTAQTKKEIFSVFNLTEAKFRKILCRLEAMNFIEIVAGSRDRFVYANEYGMEVIQKVYERSNV